MTTYYRYHIKQIAARLLLLQGGQTAAAKTNYEQTNWKSARYPMPLIVDTLADAIGNYAQVIAETANHPFRRYLQSQTANIATGAAFPATDSAGKDIIGIPGAIIDSEDSKPLTDDKSLAEIQRINRLFAAGFLTLRPYHFKRVDGRLYHTRANVKADVCFYDRDAERALILAEAQPGADPGSSNSSLLPDSLNMALIAECIALLPQVDEFLATAGHYRAFSDTVKQQIRDGIVSVSSDIPGVEGQ